MLIYSLHISSGRDAMALMKIHFFLHKQKHSYNQFKIYAEMIEQQRLSKHDVFMSHGPDGFPFIFKKKLPMQSGPLSYIFNKSLEDGILPEIWKCTCMSPVHKNRPTTYVSNYRTIAKFNGHSVGESFITDELFLKIKHKLFRNYMDFFEFDPQLQIYSGS